MTRATRATGGGGEFIGIACSTYTIYMLLRSYFKFDVFSTFCVLQLRSYLRFDITLAYNIYLLSL